MLESLSFAITVITIIIAITFLYWLRMAWRRWRVRGKETQQGGAYEGQECQQCQPVGFPSMGNLNRYWKNRPKHWGIEYSEEQTRVDMSKVKPLDIHDFASF